MLPKGPINLSVHKDHNSHLLLSGPGEKCAGAIAWQCVPYEFGSVLKLLPPVREVPGLIPEKIHIVFSFVSNNKKGKTT